MTDSSPLSDTLDDLLNYDDDDDVDDSNEIDSEDTFIYIVDRNAIIDITRIDEMMSQKNAKGLFVNYFYHVEDMMTICPLFDACYFNYAAQA